MEKENFKLKYDMSDFTRVAAVIGVILAAASLVYWLIFTVTDSTVYTFSYKEAKELYEDSLVSSYVEEYPSCDFPGCDDTAYTKVYLDPMYSNIVPKGIKVFSKMPNKAGFKFNPDSFTYTEKEEHTVYDEQTYLVPQGDGSFRIETREDKYVVHVNGETKTVNFITYEGNYCDNHVDEAKRIWHEEIEEIFITKNLGYYYFEYGLWISLAFIPVAALLGGVLYTVIYAVKMPKSKKKQ